jgi:hypothetical protein
VQVAPLEIDNLLSAFIPDPVLSDRRAAVQKCRSYHGISADAFGNDLYLARPFGRESGIVPAKSARAFESMNFGHLIKKLVVIFKSKVAVRKPLGTNSMRRSLERRPIANHCLYVLDVGLRSAITSYTAPATTRMSFASSCGALPVAFRAMGLSCCCKRRCTALLPSTCASNSSWHTCGRRLRVHRT